ncbi:SH3 domain-containing protein [Methylocystis parvus]|uniref:SH3 domain-containing protein n=1 Tax=Methylocystis parvus TaxID=134 RepID=UPI003C745EA5
MKSAFLRLAACAAAFTATAALAAPVTSPATVRSGPTKKWPVIATLPAGTDVTVVDCGGGWKRDWCHIRAGAIDGYVAAGVLAGDGNNVEVAPVVTNNDVNMYKGPGPSYRVVGTIPENTIVNQGACIYGWGETRWCKVNHAGKIGYVLESQLSRQNALFPM